MKIRKENIIEILDKYWIRRGWIESDESMVEARPLTAKEELADAIMALPIEVPSEEEQSIINDNKLQEIFNNSLTEKDKYSSNLNPFEIFKIGYVKGQVAKGIVVPNDYHIKANTPYYGKSCNKYWFEGAKWAIQQIIERNGKYME